jgi:tetratricopeptide (TPR) repeat protein
MLTAKLCFIDESPLDDVFYLDRVERLIGGRENWLFEVGALHIDAGRPERAFPLWRECLGIAPAHEGAIIHYASGFLTPAQMLAKVLPDSPETLVRIARRYFTGDDHQADRKLILTRAASLLAAGVQLTATEMQLRGSVELELGHSPEAVEWLERATTLEDTKADWFFDLARAYAGVKNWERAVSYAKLGLQLAPGSEDGQRLLDVLSDSNGKSRSIDSIGTRSP